MRTRVKIALHPLGKTIAVAAGTSLRSVLHQYGVEFPCGGHGRCAACRVKLIDGSLAATAEQAEILSGQELAQGWRLACRCTAQSDLTLEVGQWEEVILADHSTFDFTPAEGLGIAVDLGTTTIVAQLLDRESGHVLGVRTALNPQSLYGADVMNRIHAVLTDARGGELARSVRRTIGRLCAQLLRPIPDRSRLRTVVLAGNTVMHHLFCGLDVTPLSRAPFEPLETGLQVFRPRELRWAIAGDITVCFLPCIGGFVGSDILCGLLATQMHQRQSPIILVDLGTNGEIVVGNRQRMLCASTAAGPAFEGGRIAMGMRATTGAISEVWSEHGGLRCRVIGDGAARGLCGSGVVDAVAAGLDLGLIEPSGRLADPAQPLVLAEPVSLTQSDIRQLQLAKAAVAAGITILRRRFGATASGSLPIYLAGAFGNYVNKRSARRIGLIPAAQDQIEPAGNTALLGAKMAIFGDPKRNEFSELRSRIEHVPLALDPSFQEIFVNETVFPG
ncbi:MAG: DUF4445 domain-containing protein [Deltaproteobacteria bacterium]|nr:DUF4445 domain-containing protein [Deltaproteobacteria bacterium]